MAYIVMAYIVMAYIVMACIVMAYSRRQMPSAIAVGMLREVRKNDRHSASR